MKNNFSSLILLCLIFSGLTSVAQVTNSSALASTPVTTDFSFTQMVDSLMFPLNKNQITTGILYDRVYPFAALHYLHQKKFLQKEPNKYETGQVLLIDKPLYWTSFDAVRKIRNLIKIKKVGHAGTLDPLATGLLIVCTGKFTKKINEYMGMQKEYTGTFTLGAVTPTYDLESEPVNVKDISAITAEQIHEATKVFTGEIQQVPPMHSAVKKDGKPVYLLARKGIDLQLEPRTITIKSFTIEKIELPIVHFKVICTTGTYIRSLANDYGKELGTGAYLSSLRRTRIGEFSAANAIKMEDLAELLNREFLSERQSDT